MTRFLRKKVYQKTVKQFALRFWRIKYYASKWPLNCKLCRSKYQTVDRYFFETLANEHQIWVSYIFSLSVKPNGAHENSIFFRCQLVVIGRQKVGGRNLLKF